MCDYEDKANEYLNKYGVLSVTLLMYKLRISEKFAREIYYKLVQPIKVIDSENSERFISCKNRKFWKSKNNFIISGD